MMTVLSHADYPIICVINCTTCGTNCTHRLGKHTVHFPHLEWG